MKRKKQKIRISFNPVITIIVLMIGTILTSSILSLLNFDSQKTSIVNGALETSIITVNNIISTDGIRFILGSAITNLGLLEPFLLLVVSIISAGIMYESGFLTFLIRPFKKINNKTITFITLLFSIILPFLGEYSYIILLPLIALIYKGLNRNPILGILTVFLGMTLGQGAGIVYNYNDYVFGTLTELSASIDVDNSYKYSLVSTNIIRIFSTFALTVFLTYIIEKYLVSKLPKYKTEEIEIVESDRLTKSTIFKLLISFLIPLGIFVYAIVPGLPGSGILLGESDVYIARLFANNAPFKQGFIYIILIMTMIVSYIYGKETKMIKNNNDFSFKLGKYFEKAGYLLVLLFFMAQLISIINWTNLNEVLVTRLINVLSLVPLSGILLIIMMFVLTIVMTIVMPSSIAKWNLMAPLIIPLFMRSNITPDFTQFIFSVADGIGKCLTPLFIYYIIMIGFMEQNRYSDENITIFGTMKLIFNIVMIVIAFWIVIIIGWYIIGLPIGFGTYPVL